VKSALLSGLLLALLGVSSAAQEMIPPRLSFAQVDWAAAFATLADIDALRPAATAARLRPANAGVNRQTSRAFARLNAIMAQRFAGVATSPVPVLLPFDTGALLNDQAAGTADSGNERYLSGFHAAKFFYPGPAGYDAAFAIRTGDVPELSDIKFKDPIEVQISGSVLLYDLDWPIIASGQPVPALEAEFPGIRRLILEHHLRYTFVRFGVPYVVSIICFDAGVSRYRMPTCRNAEQVALRFLRALRVGGGMPHRLRPARPLPIERPAKLSQNFSYYAPGKILSGTGFRGEGGRADHTVYSQIRFPLAEAPAYANSQMFQSRNRASDPNVSPNYSYPWRDNFCERRGFPVGQCPAGIGHQGQDIRPARCKPAAGADRCTQNDDVVAVRGGVILRSRRQEAAYIFVNSAVEHIRFRYLHMNPRKMDEDDLLSGRRVHEGEVIGQVSNFSNKANGTSYHLHFDVQVPTKDGWVFVNPYMTLVAAYERLIGERGSEFIEPTLVSTTDGNGPASIGRAPAVELPKPAAEDATASVGRAPQVELPKPAAENATATVGRTPQVELPKPADEDATASVGRAPQVETPKPKPSKLSKASKFKKHGRHRHAKKHRPKKKQIQQASQ
jgi:murein DD-endopeptidase MepM/ murein hydrolase activator NlpD